MMNSKQFEILPAQADVGLVPTRPIIKAPPAAGIQVESRDMDTTYYSCPGCEGYAEGYVNEEYVCDDCGCAVEVDEIANNNGSPGCGWDDAEISLSK